MHHLGAAGGVFFIDFFEFSDFPKNRIFDPFLDSGGAGTVLDRSMIDRASKNTPGDLFSGLELDSEAVW